MRERLVAVLGFLLFALLGTGGCATRQNLPYTPFQLAIVPNIEVFAKETPVRGLGLNIAYGIQHEVNGLLIGAFNEARKLRGLSAGLVNLSREKSFAAQFGIGNVGAGEESFAGFQAGVVNQVETELLGLQVGITSSTLKGKGLQMGLFNVATSLSGGQFGILNVSDSEKSVQIGVINVNPKGFLPVFPLVNFSLK